MTMSILLLDQDSIENMSLRLYIYSEVNRLDQNLGRNVCSLVVSDSIKTNHLINIC